MRSWRDVIERLKLNSYVETQEKGNNYFNWEIFTVSNFNTRKEILKIVKGRRGCTD